MGCGSSKSSEVIPISPVPENVSNKNGKAQGQQSPVGSLSRPNSGNSVTSSKKGQESSRQNREPSERGGTPQTIDEQAESSHTPVAIDAKESKHSLPSSPIFGTIPKDASPPSRMSKASRNSAFNIRNSVEITIINISDKGFDKSLIQANATDDRSSRSSTRLSRDTPLPQINKGRTSPSSVSHVSANIKASAASHEHLGRCRYCHHCRRLKSGRILSTPKLKWITEDPGVTELTIDMDNYDADAVAKQIILDSGRMPGSYDYRPYLTIEEVTNNNTNIKDNDYYKLPFVARKNSHISPTHTPFPDYAFLQSHEQRLNKPYTIALFD